MEENRFFWFSGYRREKNKGGFALADFNYNAKMDIVFGTDSSNLYLIYDDGLIADGFPFSTDGKLRFSPIIVDNGGYKTIIVPSDNNSDPNFDNYCNDTCPEDFIGDDCGHCWQSFCYSFFKNFWTTRNR